MLQVRMKVNPVYQPMFTRDDWQFAYLRGPRDAGRSWAVAQYCTGKMLQQGGKYLFVREYQKSIKDSNFAMMKRVVQGAGLMSRFHFTKSEIVCLDTEATAIFHGIRNDPEGVMSLTDVRFTHAEQAERFTSDQFGMLIPTAIREEGAKVVMTWNPTWPEDPVEDRWANAGDESVRIWSTADDNHYKDEVAYRVSYEDMARNQPHLLRWAYHGEYRTVSENNPFGLPAIDRAYQRPYQLHDDLMLFGGVDVAWTEGQESDYTAVCIIDEVGSVHHVAQFRIADPVKRKERVIQELSVLGERRPHITYVDVTDAAGTQLAGELAAEGFASFGFRFTQSSKTGIVRAFAKRLAEDRFAFRQVELYDELRRYNEDENGKFGASTGHDDQATAAILVAEAVRRHVG